LSSVGIAKLLNEKIYTAAYPLHDGNENKDSTDRTLLNREWAALRKWCTPQPLDKIKEYFGVQVALYFAWLGFYTQMLIPVSIAGIVCFLYGFYEMSTDTIR
jgi:anoctamin-1